jgi:hypothetical protein
MSDCSPADDNFVADAAAEELREWLKQLAKQVVDMQVSITGIY